MRYSSAQYALALYNTLSESKPSEYKKIVASFVSTLAKHNRLSLGRSIALDFEKIWYKKNNLTKVTVEAAKSADFKTMLEAAIGKNIEVSEKIKPELLGGLKITVDDMRVDGTIKKRLSNLTKALGK